MRRHYTNYFKGIPDFKPFRTRLVETMAPSDLYAILDEIAETFSGQLAEV
jgi:tRNA-dihydrouridine synthase B